MNINKIIKYIFISLSIVSCSNSNDDITLIEEPILSSLEAYVENRNIETSAVIACAASAQETNDILAYYYIEREGTNVRFYETENIDANNDDFSNYTQINLQSEPFFNGALGMFTRSSEIEKWIIITYELNGEIKISNPIRTKQISKPTVYQQSAIINQEITKMPKFNWLDNAVGDNAIYFQVISDNQNNLLSGTYTFDSNFQYYDTSNVVLNITQGIPPELEINRDYNFTVMDVSEDNWVNLLILNQNFIVE
ncbi:hypothetical protein D7030_08845 [Flavobacteriaceae bacterium AU392]|nr:hypothetical protein D1817_14850 [Flavobacteriaceae bacterium]RKM84126.1 hypothetical protein D7030_08845 [Flavobacteriaceae bacterium AU392]